jgi:hypothetical protein
MIMRVRRAAGTDLLRPRRCVVLTATFTAISFLEGGLVLGLLHILLSKGSMDPFSRSATRGMVLQSVVLLNFT